MGQRHPFTLLLKITFQGKVRVYETASMRIQCGSKHR